MTTLNADGTPRKKYTTKKMIMAKNRKNGQKKAWVTRKEKYPDTNGYRPNTDQPKENSVDKLNEMAKSNKLLSSEAHRLRDREVELEEIITALKYDLKLAKAELLDGKRKEVEGNIEYRYEVERLIGELRGTNYCFQKLAEEMSKGKEVA